MTDYEFHQVDVFSAEPLKGNPLYPQGNIRAAVLLGKFGIRSNAPRMVVPRAGRLFRKQPFAAKTDSNVSPLLSLMKRKFAAKMRNK